MMGRQTGDQHQLFYSFNLDERIPEDHLFTPDQFCSDPRIGRASAAPRLIPR